MFQKTLTGGRYNESNYPVQELWRKRGGGRIFEGGVLAGHYGIINSDTSSFELIQMLVSLIIQVLFDSDTDTVV